MSVRRGILRCQHGEICQFFKKGSAGSSSGSGCRNGNSCTFCHICERTSTYDRICQVISKQRKITGEEKERIRDEDHSTRSTKNCRGLLLQIVGGCQELVLEGELAVLLAPQELFALAP